MQILRDTFNKRMGLAVAGPPTLKKEVTFDAAGNFQTLELTVSDETEYKYRVLLSRKDLLEALDELIPKEQSCPF